MDAGLVPPPPFTILDVQKALRLAGGAVQPRAVPGRRRHAVGPRAADARQTLSEIWESDSFDLATLSVALGAIRTLVTASSLPSTES
jgi:hypothetical protein